MLVLYGGYPAALEALALVREVFPEPGESREVAVRERHTLGDQLCRRVYSINFDKLLRRVHALHPDLATWMIEDGYGRVLSRPGLDARTRELVTISALAATGWRRQLVSHLLGARRLGATAEARRAAFTAGLARANASARAESRHAWREVEARRRAR